MELIDFLIQVEGAGEQEIKKSTVHLVVNQEGKERMSGDIEHTILHNCSIRNIVSDSNEWHHYFKIYGDGNENTVVVKSKLQHPFRITKIED